MVNKEWCRISLALEATFLLEASLTLDILKDFLQLPVAGRIWVEVFLHSVHMTSIGSFMSLHSKAPAFFFLEGESTLASPGF